MVIRVYSQSDLKKLLKESPDDLIAECRVGGDVCHLTVPVVPFPTSGSSRDSFARGGVQATRLASSRNRKASLAFIGESFLSAGASMPDAVKHSRNIALARQSRVAAALTLNRVFCRPRACKGSSDTAIGAPGGTSARVNSRTKFSRPFSDERLLVRPTLPRPPCPSDPRWGAASHPVLQCACAPSSA